MVGTVGSDTSPSELKADRVCFAKRLLLRPLLEFCGSKQMNKGKSYVTYTIFWQHMHNNAIFHGIIIASCIPNPIMYCYILEFT